MGLLDVLNQYAQPQDRPPPGVFDDFSRVSLEAPAADISHGLEDAFQSEATPPFEQMVGHLYEQSDPHQRAGLLNEILGSLGGNASAMAGGGVLGGLLRRLGPRVSPEDARDIPTRDVEDAAAEAARHNPGVIQTVSRFYAQHPQLVQTLGQAALGILMSGMARRRQGL